MNFKLGETVLLLNEKGSAKIVEILPNGSFRLEDEDGFIILRDPGELCKILSDEIQVIAIPSEKTGAQSVPNKGSATNGQMWEIDLHIENLLESTQGMSNFEIISHQMEVLKRFMSSARQKKIKKVLIIHGVGEGRLRSEVHTYLRGTEGVVFHNEHYTPKGFGATLVELFYSY